MHKTKDISDHTAWPCARSIDDELDEGPLRLHRFVIFGFCLMVLVLDGLDLQLLSLAAPVLAKEWNIQSDALASAIGLALVGMVVGSPVGGRAGQKFGPKKSLVAATMMFGIATLTTCFAANLAELRILRFISGVGFGAALPNAMALAGDWAGPIRRGRLIGLMTIGTSIGAVAGGFLCGWLLPVMGWRVTFLLSGSLTILTAILSGFCMSEGPNYLAVKGRMSDVVRVLNKAGLVIAISAVRPVGLARPAMEATPLFSRLYLRQNLCLWLMFFSTSYVAYAVMGWAPTFISDAGFTLRTAIIATSAFSLVTIGGSLTATALSVKDRPRALVSMAMFVGVLVFAFFAFTLPVLTYYGVIITLSLAGFCIGLSMTTMYIITSNAYSAGVRSLGVGMCVGFSRAGGIMAIAMGGALLVKGTDGRALFLGALAAMLLAGLFGSLASSKVASAG